MFKAKQRLTSIIVAFCTLVLTAIVGVSALVMPTSVTANAAEATETIKVFGTTGTLASDKSNISWVGDYFTFTNNKGSTAIRTSDSDHYRAYANSSNSIKTTADVAITKIEITCTSSSYATECQTSINNSYSGAAGVSGSVVTASFDNVQEITFKSSAQWRLKQIVITYTVASSEPECEHANQTTTTTEATCTKVGSIVVTCDDCGEEISKEEIDLKAHTETTLGAVDPTCTETGLTEGKQCTVCGTVTLVQEEVDALGHDFADPTYERNDDVHTATGTCTVCGETTTATEGCTLTYENVSNEDGTHTMTSTCSVCEQSVVTEGVACTFDEGVLNGSMLTYTCKYCGYSYEEELPTYTVTYVVPNGVEAIEADSVAEGFTTKLPTAGTSEGYTFVGWTTAELDEKTEAAPEYLVAEAEYTVEADVTFYALYSYAEGTGAWTKVTDVNALAAGKEIVIVASNSDYALGADKGNNRNAASITKDGDTVTINNDVQIITLETGKVTDTFAFNVGNGYLYAASSGSNYLKTKTALDNNGSWAITIAGGVATIKAQGTYTRNWLRKNSSNALFSCYGSGQDDVSIYMKDGATYYVTMFNTCAHSNVEEVVEEATCTESGARTVTCLDCGTVVEAEILPALGHNYIDGVCENCDKQDPASIVYDGYYYLILNNKYLDATTKDGKDRYKPVEFTPGETVEYIYVFYFVQNGEVYDMYDMKNGLYMASVTITTNNDYTVYIYNEEGNILSHNTSANYVGFYKTSNNYPKAFTFVEVESPANIDSASVTLGEDVALNYYVTMPEAFEDAKMYFTLDGETYDIDGTVQAGRYVFSLNLAPQYMATTIKAELKYNDGTMASLAEYSIKTYAQNKLNAADSSDELKQLLTDMLYYGVAAQNYTGYNTENLATDGVENLGTPSTAKPDTTNFNLATNEEISSYGAWFKGAGVWFDNVNKLYVKINTLEGVTLENVTLTVQIGDGEAQNMAVTGATVYTDGILATEFATTYTFALYYDGVLMQTLTYSINAYAYAMKDKTGTMGDLALALYRYGDSAKKYNA